MAEQVVDSPLMEAFASVTGDFETPSIAEEKKEEPVSEDREEEGETEEGATSEEAEEGEDESEEEDSQEAEESEEESETEEETKEEGDSEEEEDTRTVPLEALHAERAKRQDAQKEQATLKTKVDNYEAQMKAIKDQLKELDLEDVIEIKSAPELSPEATEALAEKQANDQKAETEKVFTSIQTEVGDRKAEYKNINYESTEQGEALMGMIVSSMFFGNEMENAVKSSMDQLNALMKNSFEAGKKVRAAPVKVKAKPTTRSRRVAKDSRADAMGKAIKTGNFDDVLSSFASDLADK